MSGTAKQTMGRPVRQALSRLTFVGALLICVTGAAEEGAEDILLEPGEQRVVDGPGADSVDVSDGSIVNFWILEKNSGGLRIILCGVLQGETTVRLLRRGQPVRSHRVRVQVDFALARTRTCEMARLLCPALADLCPFLVVSGEPPRAQGGSRLRLASREGMSKLELTAEIREPETYLKLMVVRETCPRIRIRASVEPKVLDALAVLAQAKLRQDGLTEVSAVREAGTIRLEGTVADGADRRRAEAILRAFFISLDAPVP